MVLKGKTNLISSGIKAMLFMQVVIMAFWKAEYSGAVLNRAWEWSPVSSPMLPHGFYKLEFHLAIWTGTLFFGGWWMMDLQVLDQCLLCMVPPATCLAVVSKFLAATGDLVHVHHVTAGEMFATFLTHMVGLPPMHPEMPSQCLRSGEVLSAHITVHSMLCRLGNLKWYIPRCGSSGSERRG